MRRSGFQLRTRTLSQTVAETAALAAGHALDNLSGWLDYQPPLGAADKLKLDRSASLTPQLAAEMQQMEALQSEADSELTKLRRMRVPKNPLISPMYASDEQLRALPPIWFVVSEQLRLFSLCMSLSEGYCMR